MRILQKISITAVVIGFLFLLFPVTSLACSCVPPGSVQEEMERSSAVFSGKVVEIVNPNEKNEIQSSADLVAVKIEVTEWWKGGNESEVIVYTEMSSASCGFEFSLNEEYIVYAHEDDDGKIRVSLCSRTAQLQYAEEDLKELGEAEKPVKQVKVNTDVSDVSVDNTVNANPTFLILVVGGMGLVTAIILLFVTRHRRN